MAHLIVLDNATGQRELEIKGRTTLYTDLKMMEPEVALLRDSAKTAHAHGFTKFQHGGKWHRVISA